MLKHRVVRAWLEKHSRVAALALAAATASLAVQADASQPGAATDPIASPASAVSSTRIITLGTAGGPRLHSHRGQPANLVKVGGRLYLVDAGPGVSHKLAAAGIRAKDIDKIFLTHLHFDHFGGLNSLLGFAWVQDANKTIDIYGPPATGAFVESGERYLTNILSLYVAQMPPTRPVSEMVKTHDVDITKPTVIYQDDKVRVSAVENSHFVTLPADRRPLGAARSYSYRFDTPDRSIVFAGDTGPSDAVAELAKGADVLVSQGHDIDQALVDLGKNERLKPLIDHMRHEHLSPQEVGRIAAKAGVKMVVLTHLTGTIDTESGMRRVMDGVRAAFSGTVIVARDGDEF